jgi:putative transposase
MGKKKRTFSKEDKINILNEASKNGVNITLEKHNVYPATYYSWKKKYEDMGEEGFKHGMTKKQQKEIRRLEKENSMLKKIVVEKELEVRLQQEFVKKKYPHLFQKK